MNFSGPALGRPKRGRILMGNRRTSAFDEGLD